MTSGIGSFPPNASPPMPNASLDVAYPYIDVAGLAAGTAYDISVQAATTAALVQVSTNGTIAQGTRVLHMDNAGVLNAGDAVRVGSVWFVVAFATEQYLHTSTAVPVTEYYDGELQLANVTVSVARDWSAAAQPLCFGRTASPSLPTGALTPMTVPSSTTGGAITLLMRPPIDSGGIAITDYVVYMARQQSLNVVVPVSDFVALGTASSTASTENPVLVVTGLNSSTLYVFFVTPRNLQSACAASPPEASARMNVSTLSPTTPTAPRSVIKVTTTGGSITVICTRPTDIGGVRTITYILYFSSAENCAQANVSSFQDAGNQTVLALQTQPVFSVYALAPATAYCVFATVATTAGTSSPSPRLAVSTTSATTPGPCAAPVQQYGSGGRLVVGFTPPLGAMFCMDVASAR